MLVYSNTGSVRQEIKPIRARRPDTAQVFATFDLRGVAPTFADVVLLEDGGQLCILSNSFRIETGLPEQLVVSVAGTSAIRRVGRGSARAEYQVRVRNVSNQDAEFVTLQSWIPGNMNLSSNVRISGVLTQPLQSLTRFLFSAGALCRCWR